jgi:hypothetical protein
VFVGVCVCLCVCVPEYVSVEYRIKLYENVFFNIIIKKINEKKIMCKYLTHIRCKVLTVVTIKIMVF